MHMVYLRHNIERSVFIINLWLHNTMATWTFKKKGDTNIIQNSLPRQDSNLESSAPEADALSIRPRETLEDVHQDYGS